MYKAYKRILQPAKITENKDLDTYLTHLGFTSDTGKYLLKGCPEHSWKDFQGVLELVDSLIELQKKDKNVPLCIVGDYDADGVTSTAIFYHTLKILGFTEVKFYIPHRIKDGYGLSNQVVDNVLQAFPNTNTILTCDNGIVAKEAIQYAKTKDVTVIVTDHHTPNDDLKEIESLAFAVIHPQGSPFREISGAEVVYKLYQGVVETLGIHDAEMDTYMLQLASISIVSDVMPIANPDTKMKYNENRELLRRGLESIRTNPNWHLKALLDEFKIDPGTVDETTIGFYIAPAINAVGRLTSAKSAVDCLITEDKNDISRLTGLLKGLNEERKRLKKECMEAILPEVDTTKSGILITHSNLPEGLVGILAGNLCEEYQRPTIVFTDCLYDGQPAWKGSGRSVADVNMYDLIDKVNHQGTHPLTVAFGGHAGAAGLTVLDSDIEEFKVEFEKALLALDRKEEALDKHYVPIFAGNIRDIAEAMQKVKPFGNGLPLPEFRANIYINQIDFYFGSNSVKCSSVFWNKTDGQTIGNEFWLFDQADTLVEDTSFMEGFELRTSNFEKRLKEMSRSEAKNGRWESWKAIKGEKPIFDVIFQLDYTADMQGKMSPSIHVKEIQRTSNTNQKTSA